MKNIRRRLGVLMAGLGLAGFGMVASTGPTEAADHTEPPGNDNTAARNIGDLFAWHQGDKLVAVLTVSGAALPSAGASYDADTLYGVHIDNDGDNVADIDVWIRMGQDEAGNWGVKVENLPGASGDVVGAVETHIDTGPTRVFVGLRDDPFFFDLEGFTDTVTTGSLQFASLTMGMARDSLAGTNATAIVLEMDLAAATAGGTTVRAWATTAGK
jgi:Domain of unknown function (DUF4331)